MVSLLLEISFKFIKFLTFLITHKMAIFFNNKSTGSTLNELKFKMVDPSKEILCYYIQFFFMQ